MFEKVSNYFTIPVSFFTVNKSYILYMLKNKKFICMALNLVLRLKSCN